MCHDVAISIVEMAEAARVRERAQQEARAEEHKAAHTFQFGAYVGALGVTTSRNMRLRVSCHPDGESVDAWFPERRNATSARYTLPADSARRMLVDLVASEAVTQLSFFFNNVDEPQLNAIDMTMYTSHNTDSACGDPWISGTCGSSGRRSTASRRRRG
jgi:hypothetical protein